MFATLLQLVSLAGLVAGSVLAFGVVPGSVIGVSGAGLYIGAALDNA